MSQSRQIRAGGAFVEIGARTGALAKGLRTASAKLKAFGAGVRNAGLKLFAGGAAVIAPLLAAVQHFASAGDQLNKMAARTGVSTEALSELGFAAEQSGSDLETLERGVMRMQAAIVDAAQGSKSARSSLAALGLTVEELADLSPEQQFKTLADRLSQVEDPTLKAALAMELFGKSGQKLIPLLDAGRDGIEALQREARGLGLTVGTSDAQAAADYADALNRMRRAAKAVAMAIGAALAPMLTDLMGQVTRYVVMLADWIKENRQLVVTIFKVAAGVAAAGAGLVVLGTAITAIGAVLGGLAGIAAAVAAAFKIMAGIVAFLLSPLGLVIVAVAALGAYLLYTSGAGSRALEWLAARFQRLKEDALKAFQGISDALAAGDLQLAARILWLTLKMEWKRGIHFLNGLWVRAKDFFLGLWQGAVTETAKLINNAWAGIETAWVETVAVLSDAWTLFTSMLTRTWHTAIGFIRKAWVRLKSLFDADVDVEAEVERINRETGAATSANDRRLLDSLAASDAARRGRLEQIERDRAAIEATLEEERAREAARRQRAYAESLARSEAELAAARREWEEAIAEAAQKRAEQEREARRGRIAGIGAAGIVAGAKQRLDAAGGLLAAQDRAFAAGTFQAAAVRGLGAESLAERTARGVEQVAAHAKDLVDQAKQGRLVFAD